MHVNHSGWSKDHGHFSCDIFIDEHKTDYALVYGDGTVCRQTSPFTTVRGDWNNDGDVYEQFGAWFQGLYGGGTFMTPVDLVSAAINGVTKDRFSKNEIQEVRGVTVPLPERRPRLEDRIRQSENRAMHQEAERNRRMNALGIRNPGEPWAR